MIDVQAELYTIGRNAVLEQFPDAVLSSTETLKPVRFPYVSIIEEDNSVYKRTSDSRKIENHARLMIQVDCYTTGDRKQQVARSIMGIIDETYGNIGLRREMLFPTINYNDTSIYRMTARYTCVVSDKKEIYRG